MIEYSYKQICEECVMFGECRDCDNCNGIGYTESTSVELPDGAYDIVKEKE